MAESQSTSAAGAAVNPTKDPFLSGTFRRWIEIEKRMEVGIIVGVHEGRIEIEISDDLAEEHPFLLSLDRRQAESLAKRLAQACAELPTAGPGPQVVS